MLVHMTLMPLAYSWSTVTKVRVLEVQRGKQTVCSSQLVSAAAGAPLPVVAAAATVAIFLSSSTCTPPTDWSTPDTKVRTCPAASHTISCWQHECLLRAWTSPKTSTASMHQQPHVCQLTAWSAHVTITTYNTSTNCLWPNTKRARHTTNRA